MSGREIVCGPCPCGVWRTLEIKHSYKLSHEEAHAQNNTNSTHNSPHTTHNKTAHLTQVTRTAGVLTHASIMTPRTLHYYTAA